MNIFDYLKKYRRFAVLVLLVASLVMMAFTGRQGYEAGFLRNSAGFVLSGGQVLFANIGNWFVDRFEFFRDMNIMHAENQRLREENERLEAALAQYLHLDEENRRLAELVNLHRIYEDYSMLAASIISHSPGNWSASFIVNRGQADGIAVNMAVLGAGGLVGRISMVGPNYAVVTPLIEDGFAVAAEGVRSGDWGSVSGDINLSSYGLVRMNYIERDADLVIGDEVMTSSISSIFPPGIHIGHITSINQTPGGARYAIVAPSVDFLRLSLVLIVTDIFEIN